MPPWCCPRPRWFWRPPCAGWHAAYLRTQMVRPAGYAPASQRWRRHVLATGPWPRSPADGSKARRRVAAITAAKREGSAGPGQIPMPRCSLYKIVRPRRQPATHQVAAVRRTAIHNKERTPLRALVSRTRRYFTADVSVFQAHLPCDPLSIFSYR